MDRFDGVFPLLLNRDYRAAVHRHRERQREEREALDALARIGQELNALIALEEDGPLSANEQLAIESLYEAVIYFLAQAETALRRSNVAEMVVAIYEDYANLL